MKPKRMKARLWWAVRRRVLERDGFRCRKCGRAGRLEVDHIRPLHHHGDDSLDNLQTLCRGCHIDKTAAENSRTPGQVEWRRRVNAYGGNENAEPEKLS